MTIKVATNSTPSSRTGMVTFNTGQAININQGAGNCTYAFSTTTGSVLSGGGTGSAPLTAGSGCTWNAVSSTPWLTIPNASGTAGGPINYTASPNQSITSRVGVISVGPANFIVTQAGVPNYTGNVDSSACSGIVGWAADKNRLNTSITISLWDGATQIGTATANGSRPDIATLLSDNGLHGFTLAIPASYMNGVAHTLQIHYEGGSTSLPGSPVTLTCNGGPIQPSRAAVWRNGTWVIDNGNFNWDGTTIDFVTTFGQPGDTPIFGDWDGSGKTKIGVYRNGEWFLDTNGNGVYDPGVDQHGFFGGAGDIPVVGDWDGSGKTKVGVFRRGVWVLDMNGNVAYDAGIDRVGSFGAPTDVPVVGDWTGDKKSKVGVYRAGVWLLDTNGNTNFDPGVDLIGSFGAPTDVIALGDWTGNGITKVGVYRNGAWVLDMNGNANWDPGVDLVGSFGGGPTDRPVVGDWDGSGKTKIGIYRDGVWILDLTNTALYNPGTVRIGSFGIPSDTPLTGKWSKP